LNTMQPIRDPEMIKKLMNYFKGESDRDLMLFVLGISTGLRISDIRKLKVGDLKDKYIKLREKKTGKERLIPITPDLRREIKPYLEGKSDEEYILKSREGKNQPISRSMAYKILNKAARKHKLRDIGTHTLRKTFGYHFYQQTKDIAMLRRILNHSSDQVTLRYIGIEQDHIDKAMYKVKFF
jgi:integrase